LCLRSTDTLYGRHWGCDREIDGLHFEACYYQGIDYCIRQGLKRFEPGAQGEHKVWRGFEPTPTWSAHWLADPAFHRLIAGHLQQERAGVAHYIEEMHGHLPFRSPA
ncbi:MAG: peptidogalycan biosysnthesis protein, partial [Chromatiaceae bacterium]